MNILLTGAAGFIGSNLAKIFIDQGHHVFGIDNLCRGAYQHLNSIKNHHNFSFYQLNIAHEPILLQTLREINTQHPIEQVWHMAANSDIVAGIQNASIDLENTFLTTYTLLQVMQKLKIEQLAFASSSAIYGEHLESLSEQTGPLLPISNYGAMKLASEALISASTEHFLKKAWIFRFPNVVGSPATHGVIFDFLQQLKKNPKKLAVLGNGTQQKPYLHVSELIAAMCFIVAHAKDTLNYFNIGPSDKGVTVKQIAESVSQAVGNETKIYYGETNKGWIGDIPQFSYQIDKLKNLGWSPKLTSLAAIKQAIHEIATDEAML